MLLYSESTYNEYIGFSEFPEVRNLELISHGNRVINYG